MHYVIGDVHNDAERLHQMKNLYCGEIPILTT